MLPGDEELRKVRILSDRGIMQAIDFGLIRITPDDDMHDPARIQPASLDIKIASVEDAEAMNHIDSQDTLIWPDMALPSGYLSMINLTEAIDFGQFRPIDEPHYISVSTEARSSARRLGIFMANWGSLFFSGPDFAQIELGNFGPNDVRFQPGDRIAQVLFIVKPWADYIHTNMHDTDHVPKPLESGEMIRSLDMGEEVRDEAALRNLGSCFDISPGFSVREGLIEVHASDKAYRLRKIEGGIDFSRRKEYEGAIEEIDIRRGYTIRPYDHVFIETRESFELSTHIGIRFWDNFAEFTIERDFCKPTYPVIQKDLMENLRLLTMTDGWIDPGYKGGFSRQPKWLTERTIYPGDVIGYGQLFFFPKGVERPYGDSALASQYQHKKNPAIAK